MTKQELQNVLAGELNTQLVQKYGNHSAITDEALNKAAKENQYINYLASAITILDRIEESELPNKRNV